MKTVKLIFLMCSIGLNPLNVFSQSTDTPNVIFVMPDDISHSDFSYYKKMDHKHQILIILQKNQFD